MSLKKPILELAAERHVILDGAMGSRLIDLGLQPGIPPESWNITHPDKIKQIHLEYFNAGSDIVLTNTFGGSRLKLEAHGRGDKVREYSTRAVEIAKEICPTNGYIAGDIGPSGKFLPPVGLITEQELADNFTEQTEILAEADVDLFFIETMVDLKEAEIAVKAAKKTSNIPIFASMTYKKTKRGFFTIMGNTVEQCTTKLKNAGADAIGANCTIASDEMIDLIVEISNFTDLPVIAKPNAGLPQLIDGKTVYLSKPEVFAKDLSLIASKGARIVGGCCGSTPEFIKKIALEFRRG